LSLARKIAARKLERQRLHNIAIVGECSFGHPTEKLQLENHPSSRPNSYIRTRSGSRMARSGRCLTFKLTGGPRRRSPHRSRVPTGPV